MTTPTYRDYATAAISRLVTPGGAIVGYPTSPYNIDDIMSGRNLLELHQRTGEMRYRTAAGLLRGQLQTHPRNAQGGFWHKQNYPNQMWLDGLYMGEPFYSRYAALHGETAIFDDVVLQFRLIDANTYDATAQLWYHAWFDRLSPPPTPPVPNPSWADPTTGRSPIFWGRGMGWYGMALVDTLDYLPLSHPGRSELMAALQRFAECVVRHQHPMTGVWYQIIDQPNLAGNYLEASASSMFAYVLAKGVNKGYLGASVYKPAALRGYTGVINEFVTGSGSDYHLHRIRAGLGVGGTTAHYLNAGTGQILSDDHKGVGAFVLAGCEIETLANAP